MALHTASDFKRFSPRARCMHCFAVVAVAIIASLFTAATAYAGDAPTGWYYGTDSSGPAPTGSGPYSEPDVGGGAYGGYYGMIGAWWQLESNCSSPATDFKTSYAEDANYNQSHSDGAGAGAYFYVGGPAEDPHYNGSDSEAYNWGWDQAEQADSDYVNGYSSYVTFPVLFMDIEQGNGWNYQWTNHCGQCNTSSCGYTSAQTSPNLDRCTFNGFWDYFNGQEGSCSLAAPSTVTAAVVTARTSARSPGTSATSAQSLGTNAQSRGRLLKLRVSGPDVLCCGGGSLSAGVYSSYDYWNSIFEVNGSLSQYGDLGSTYEWAYSPTTGEEQVSSSSRPTGFTMTYDSDDSVESSADIDAPDFFGGIAKTSPYALMWQWAGQVSNEPSNPYGDFDQLNGNNVP